MPRVSFFALASITVQLAARTRYNWYCNTSVVVVAFVASEEFVGETNFAAQTTQFEDPPLLKKNLELYITMDLARVLVDSSDCTIVQAVQSRNTISLNRSRSSRLLGNSINLLCSVMRLRESTLFLELLPHVPTNFQVENIVWRWKMEALSLKRDDPLFREKQSQRRSIICLFMKMNVAGEHDIFRREVEIDSETGKFVDKHSFFELDILHREVEIQSREGCCFRPFAVKLSLCYLESNILRCEVEIGSEIGKLFVTVSRPFAVKLSLCCLESNILRCEVEIGSEIRKPIRREVEPQMARYPPSELKSRMTPSS
ncbi:hypothetical protein F3Y22_tig00110324pilonHSYRG00039 [Hibiscus syriacus]|uniref:Uncharacterized protein n=1 Tax=Hibiscus syriacus TaxID=106335 RepID=A0A6A3B5I8_HIBSY|nr:hypothetical protein F3Y22_tig00110324pilonHSYRG00039 [Hibiscus syriacus]